ncbi:MAG: hypothetical protein QW577_02140 [Candidatus Bathyarchaeia archaeon]
MHTRVEKPEKALFSDVCSMLVKCPRQESAEGLYTKASTSEPLKSFDVKLSIAMPPVSISWRKYVSLIDAVPDNIEATSKMCCSGLAWRFSSVS